GDAAHGDAAHGDAAHGDAAHGDAAHGGHHDPWADEDHDGTPSWLDPTLGDEPNEAYALNGLKWHLINLLLLLGVLGYFAKKPLMSFLAGRAAEIREEVQDAAALKAEADARHQALIARMEAFDGEVRAIEEDAVRRAAEEEAKLKERSEHAAAQILDNATRQIREETSRAQAALRTEAVELAVQLAERTLRETVQADDQRRLAAQFLETLRAAEVKHG
ncbi:MAG: ATP synthase F0 subunit B, partial [Deltaproteobacteria bacterium]|nr:ATP synthase F0 subunit B [Deltaproteobacteria bacterium]